MKSFGCFVFVAVLSLALAKTPMERLRELSESCKGETGITEETLQKLRSGIEVVSPEVDAQAICVLKKAEMLNDNGDLLIDNIKSKFNKLTTNKEGVDKLVAKCAVKKDTAGATATNFIKCVHAAAEKAKKKSN